MVSIRNYVDVQITRQTQQIDIASFNIPLILAIPEGNVTTRTAVFSDLESVASEYGTTSKIYTMASRLFGQSIKPSSVVVGHVLKTQEDDGQGGVVEVIETYVDALTAVIAENDTWYAVVADTHIPQDVQELAAYVEGLYKMYFTSSQDINLTSATSDTDIGYILHNRNYDRTVVTYSENADEEYPEAAWLWQLQNVAGSNSWAFKALSGVTISSKLTDTQINALVNKNVNYFIRIANAPIMLEGWVASGEWIDTIILVDWIQARIQENVFFRLVNMKKIPMTNAGVAIIENEIRGVLDQAVKNGGIAPTPQYTVTSPEILAVPETNRAKRILGDFNFTARLAGAVHKTVIRGTVTY